MLTKKNYNLQQIQTGVNLIEILKTVNIERHEIVTFSLDNQINLNQISKLVHWFDYCSSEQWLVSTALARWHL